MSIWKVLGITYSFLSVLYLASYLDVYRKKIWISHYDIEDIKLNPQLANQGYYIIRYTLIGAILKCVGFGGIVALIMRLTDKIWMTVISLMSFGTIWRFGLNGWDILVLCSVTASIVCFIRVKSKIIVG